MNNLTKFRESLSELMQLEGLTSGQLGAAIGVNGSTVWLWAAGKRNIRLSNAVKLCTYFNCSLEFLTGRTDKHSEYCPKTALSFYDCLRALMNDRGITRYRIVKNLKKSHHHFDQWKAGADPFLQTVLELAEYFGVAVDYFIGQP